MTADISEMESKKWEFLRSIDSLNRESEHGPPEFLKRVDTELLSHPAFEIPPFDKAAFSPDTARFADRLSRESGSMRRRILISDLEFIGKISESGAEVIHRDSLGFIQGGFPVCANGGMAACVWTGRLSDRAMDGKTFEEIVRDSGITIKEVESLAARIPVFTEKQIERIFEIHRRWRDSLELILKSHLSMNELDAELKESERVLSLGSLSSGIAHHFNNLLSVILGYSSFLINRKDLPDYSRHALEQIAEAAQRGRRLTQEVLSFAGSEVETETPCPVHEILVSVLSLLKTQATSRLTVNTELNASNDTVTAPLSSIHQIVFNLLSNAIESMPEGGSLYISTRNMDIEEGGSKARYMKIEVLDSATPGTVTAEKHPAASSPRLSSLHDIVKKLEGSATVSQDACYTNRAEVLLPVSEYSEDSPEEDKGSGSSSPTSVWVVDDDPIFREMCRQVLSEYGHIVRELSSGLEMQAAWTQTREFPGLLIIDFSMPECNGLELCEWLQQQGSEAAVILVSGFAPTQPDIHKALQMRRTFFLQKPFPVPELEDAVSVALGEKLLHDS